MHRKVVSGASVGGRNRDGWIEWFTHQEFRLALLRDWTNGSPWLAIDFTRYDLQAHEPQTPQREWSLMNVLNQKGTRPQDKPTPPGQMSADDQLLIYARYPELKSLA